MSRFAGRLSLQDALALRCRLGHEGHQGVLVIGAGQAGMEAAHLAGALGHRLDGDSDLLGQQRVVARAIATHRPDVIIATAKHGSELAPCLLPAQTHPEKLMVILWWPCLARSMFRYMSI